MRHWDGEHVFPTTSYLLPSGTDLATDDGGFISVADVFKMIKDAALNDPEFLHELRKSLDALDCPGGSR